MGIVVPTLRRRGTKIRKLASAVPPKSTSTSAVNSDDDDDDDDDGNIQDTVDEASALNATEADPSKSRNETLYVGVKSCRILPRQRVVQAI